MAAPQLGSCTSSGRAWQLWAAQPSQWESPGHWAPSFRLRCSNQPHPSRRFRRPLTIQVVLGVALLLQRFDFAFERGDRPLQYKYDLTLNLQGTALCTATVKSDWPSEAVASEAVAPEGAPEGAPESAVAASESAAVPAAADSECPVTAVRQSVARWRPA